MDRIDEFLKSLLNKTKEERDLLRGKKHVCPSEETSACYLDNLLKDTEKEDFEEHLAECGDCLQQIILLYDIKKEVEQSGYMEVPTEATEQAKNLVQGEVGDLGSIIPEEPVPAGSLAPESSEKSLSSIISEFISNTIMARRGYRFVSYGSIALIVMLSVGVYSVIPTLPPEQPTLPSPNDYGIITRGGAPTQLTEQVIEEIDVNDLIKEPKTALPKEDIQPVEELVEKTPVEPSKDNVTLEGKWEGTKTDSIEPEISELTPPEAEEEETITVLETKQKDASVKAIHKVKQNDSLFAISRKYYGDEAKWHKIYEVNRDNMSGPNALYIGQELLIPEITLAKKVPLSIEAPIMKKQDNEAPTKTTEHTVVPGDTLYHLARKYYDDSTMWKIIYEANEDTIVNESSLIEGQILIIPE